MSEKEESPKFTLNLDRPRELKFDNETLEFIRKELGLKNLNDPDFNFTHIPLIALAGLRWEDKRLKYKKVKRMLEERVFNSEYHLYDMALTTIKAFDHYLNSMGYGTAKMKIPKRIIPKKR